MKTKVFTYRNLLEVQFPNGIIETQLEDETTEDFKASFKADSVDVDWDKARDLNAIKRGSTDQLLKAEQKAKGLHLEMIKKILDARLKRETKDVKDIPVVGAEEVKAAPKKEAKKQAKPKKAKKTLEQVLSEAQKAKANVKKTVTFCAFREATKQTGLVRSVWIDKRVPMALYKIQITDDAGNKSIKNKLVTCETLSFD